MQTMDAVEELSAVTPNVTPQERKLAQQVIQTTASLSRLSRATANAAAGSPAVASPGNSALAPRSHTADGLKQSLTLSGFLAEVRDSRAWNRQERTLSARIAAAESLTTE
jgi:hypothetical protein